MPIGTANAAMPLRATVTPVSRAAAVVPAMPPAVRRLERLVTASGESPMRPFAMGRCRMDARTVEAWRRISQRVVRSLGATHLGYSDARGLPDLRRTLCEYLRAARAVRC